VSLGCEAELRGLHSQAELWNESVLSFQSLMSFRSLRSIVLQDSPQSCAPGTLPAQHAQQAIQLVQRKILDLDPAFAAVLRLQVDLRAEASA